jgi:hypothetical protein
MLVNVGDAEAFRDVYDGSPPPWEIGRPQPRFQRLAAEARLAGHVLAEGKAIERGLTARFVVGTVFELQALGEQYDTVLDFGLFHNFDGEDQQRFLASLAAAMRPGGRHHMLGFSDKMPGDAGPHRLSRNELRGLFSTDTWMLESLEEDTIEVRSPIPVPAWYAIAVRR